ncbi:RAI1-domain-containing protein [Amylocystis lapponica]|nr:RAI1-domain-containing protein [Amylocystis lapponica]
MPVTAEEEVHDTSKYAQPPDGTELRYRYERWVRRPEEKGRLDGLLKAVSRVRPKFDASRGNGAGWLRDVGVVSWRGVMTKLIWVERILTALYEERDSWEMNVMMEGRTLYLEEHLSGARLAEMSVYGYGHPCGLGGDVDTNAQWCGVVKTNLGNTRMVIGGEVGCVRDRPFVEFKISLVIRGPQDKSRFEKKLLKFYFQSFLLGVPEILVGFRTPSGRLTTVQLFKTIQLPRLVRGKPHAWDPLICLDRGHRDVQKTEDSHSRTREGALQSIQRKVWRVKFTHRVGGSVSLLDSTGVDEVEAAEDRVAFLPKWYWEDLQTDGVDRPAEHHATAAGTESAAVHGWKV